MATITADGDGVTLRLEPWERIGALHGDVHIPKAAVRGVRVVEDAMTEVGGFRSPGTGAPGVVALGTYRHSDGKDFLAVRGHAPGLVLELEGHEFLRVVATVDHPQQVAASLQG